MAIDALSIDTSQLDSFVAQAENLPAEMQASMLKKATRAAAEVIDAEVVLRAPVRVDMPTPGSTGLKPYWVKADIHITPAPNGWFIGPSALTAWVVRFVEFGHRIASVWGMGKGGQLSWQSLTGRRRRAGTRKVLGHVPAHPFLRPAFETAKKPAAEAASASLAAQIAAWWKSKGQKAA